MRLETERLVLREFVEDDATAVLAYQQTPEYQRLRGRDTYTVDDARKFVGTFIAWQSETPRQRYQLAVALKSEPRLIGTCGIRVQNAGSGEATIGYELHPAYWRQGYATEAASRMLSFAFRELSLRRVVAWCHIDNAGSIRVLENLGMHCEGRSGSSDSVPERWRNHFRFALAAPG
jgi:[ribosomal protein S5]-alanine N-acetyltransferase